MPPPPLPLVVRPWVAGVLALCVFCCTLAAFLVGFLLGRQTVDPSARAAARSTDPWPECKVVRAYLRGHLADPNFEIVEWTERRSSAARYVSGGVNRYGEKQAPVRLAAAIHVSFRLRYTSERGGPAIALMTVILDAAGKKVVSCHWR